MALEGANLINSTAVYDTRNSMNTYQKALQQQQLKAAQEQKALQEQLSSIKPDGIREADKPEFYKLFEDWRNKSIEASQERDPQKKMIKQNEAEKSKLDLASLLNDSKNYQKIRDQANAHYIGKDPLDDYDQKDWEAWKQSDKLPVRNPNTVKDLSALQIVPNTDSFVKDLSGINDQLLKSKGTYISQKGDRITSGNKTGTIFRNIKTVSPELQQSTYMDYLATNRKAYKAAQALYPQLAQQLPKDEFIKQVSADLAVKNPIKVEEAPKYIFHARERQGDGGGIIQIDNSNNAIPIQDKNVPVKNIIRASPTAFNLGGITAYDTKTDKQVKIPNIEGGVKLAQYGYYPFAKAGNVSRTEWKGGKPNTVKSELAGKLVQQDYANQNPDNVEWRPMALVSYTYELGNQKRQKDLLIPIENLPKDKKDIQKYVNALKSNPVKVTQSAQPTQSAQGKTYLTKYGTFTEQQLKDNYGDAWKQALDKIKK